MHVLRLLRIFILVVIGAALVAGTVLVLTSRSELQRSHKAVEATWAPLRRQLDPRYTQLMTANQAVEQVPGPLHEIVTDVDAAYAEWRDLVTHDGGVTEEVEAANNLESLGRRLVQAARKAPRLATNPQALTTVNAFAGLPAATTAQPFNDAIDHFEEERNRPARQLAARILGYESIPTYDAPASAPT